MCHQTNLLALPLASWGLSANGDKLRFCYLKQSRERGLTSTQGDFDCGASFQADFILNYFLSNSSIFLSNSPFPPSRWEPGMAIAVKTAFLVKDLHRASLSVTKGQLTYSYSLSFEKKKNNPRWSKI